MPDYLPRSDRDVKQWTATMAALVSEAPADFLLTPERAAAYVELQQQFDAALSRTLGNATDSTTATIQKNALRQALVAETRAIVGLLRASPGSMPTLSNLGLRPRKPPTRIGKPTSTPTVDLLELRGRSATILLRDPDSPNRRGMPRGVRFGSIFTCVTDGGQPGVGDAWTFLQTTSRARRQIVLPRDPTTTHVWVCARWVNPRGQAGHASVPLDVSGWHRVMKMPSLPLRHAA